MSRFVGDLGHTIARKLANARFMVGWWEGEHLPDLADAAKAAAARARVAQLERLLAATKSEAPVA